MSKILFWSFGNYRDLSLCGDMQAICRLHTVSFYTFFVTHLADFIFYLFVHVFIFLLSETMIIDTLSVV